MIQRHSVHVRGPVALLVFVLPWFIGWMYVIYAVVKTVVGW